MEAAGFGNGGCMQCNAIPCKDPRRAGILCVAVSDAESGPRLFAAVCAMVHDAWGTGSCCGWGRERCVCRVSGRAGAGYKTVVRLFLSAVVIVQLGPPAVCPRACNPRLSFQRNVAVGEAWIAVPAGVD